jgi:hypothetical protein
MCNNYQNAKTIRMDVDTVTKKNSHEEILNKFIVLRMIIFENNCYEIRNWGKYQSADKLEEIRKSNRERQRKFREKSKMKDNVTEVLE